MNTAIRELVNGNGLRAQISRAGAGSVLLKAASVGLGLLVAVILARALGTKGYGTYAYILALMSLLAIPAQFGLPALVVRETAKADALEDWGLMRGLWRWSSFAATGLSLLIALLGGILAWRFADRFSATQLATFAWGLLFIPLITLGSLRGAALRGLRKVVQGQFPEQVIRPLLLIGLVAVAWTLARREVTAPEAMALNALASAAAFFIGAWLLFRARPEKLKARPKCVYRSRNWTVSSLPLALTAGVVVLNTQIDIIMLGWFGTAHDVGVYSIAVKGATLVQLGFIAIGFVARPYFARFYATHDMKRLQKFATISARASLGLALPAALAFFLYGGGILRLVFGPGYEQAYLALAVLAGVELVRVCFGYVGEILDMSGHERDTLKGFSIAVCCNVVLNLVLIPTYGLVGAAIATGTARVTWNVLLWRRVRYRLKIDASALGTFRDRSPNTALTLAR